MKLKVVLIGLLVAGLGASAAIAGPPPGKGKPPTTGDNCKPKVAVILKGELTATPGAGAASLSVDVMRSNRWGRAYVRAAQPTAVGLDQKTKVRRRGQKRVDALMQGDRVVVHARACKADLAEGATPALTAARVVAHPKKAETSS